MAACIGPFASDLVGNPRDRFSHEAAHLSVDYNGSTNEVMVYIY